MINAKIDDKKCVITLKGIENNAKNMNRAMRIIALEMEESVRENFEVGGRYSSPGSLLGGNHKWVKGKYGGSLIKTGNLRDSITSKSGDDFAQVGTNIAYAKIHNFGATVAGKTIIPREKKALSFVFLVLKKSPYKMEKRYIRGRGLLWKTLKTWITKNFLLCAASGQMMMQSVFWIALSRRIHRIV